jgi:hypothetical protein
MTNTSMIARSVGRDLLRRRGALALLIALPGAFYLSVSGEDIPPGEEPWTLTVGAIGIAWAVAGGAFYLALSAQRVDTRLLLGGYQRSQLLAGRLAFLTLFGTAVAAIYTIGLGIATRAEPIALALALFTTGLVAVAVGLALAALLPRELEGTIALVLVVGVQSSVPVTSPVAPYLPFYGPTQLLRVGWFSTGSVIPWLAHAAMAATIILVAAAVSWWRTTTTTVGAAREPVATV